MILLPEPVPPTIMVDPTPGGPPPAEYVTPGTVLRDRRSISSSPGWYIDADIALVFADLRGRSGGMGFVESGDDLSLDANVGMLVGIGYTFTDPRWTFVTNYRYFGTSGAPSIDLGDTGGFTPSIELKSRLDVNEFNWILQRQILLPNDRLRLAVNGGARLGSVYYDLNIHSQFNFPGFEDQPPMNFTVDARGSQYFIGAGPVAGLGADFALLPGWSLFGTGDFAALFGKTTTKMSFQTNAPMIDVLPSTSERQNSTAKVLRTSTGLNYAPTILPHMSFQLGYQFEYWWDVARSEGVSQDMLMQGLFGQLRVGF